MVWARRFWLKLQSLFRRDENAQRLDDEVKFHLEQQVAENIAAGMNSEEACFAAMRTFGNPTYLKEQTRDTWGLIWLEQIIQDLRYALACSGSTWVRTLSRRRGEKMRDGYSTQTCS